MQSGPTIYITHGYEASPDKHWFPWLEEELKKDGAQTIRLKMPEPAMPLKEKWLAYMEESIPFIGPDSYFIGHSLGCIATLLFLNRRKQKAGGLILVAGFQDPIPELPALDNFLDEPINFASLQQNIPHRVVFGSPQDYIVPFNLTRALAERLNATLVQVPDAGHFMGEDGFETFPALRDRLRDMIHRQKA